LDLKANIFLYYVHVEQEHSHLSSIDEGYYAHVTQEHSHLSSIDEDYYARIKQKHESSIVDWWGLFEITYRGGE